MGGKVREHKGKGAHLGGSQPGVPGCSETQEVVRAKEDDPGFLSFPRVGPHE